MESIPASVANRSDWPLLRRTFNMPVPAVRRRMDAWKRLAESGAPLPTKEVREPRFPGIRRPGIFSPSRIYWQNMFASEARLDKFRGHVWRDGRVVPGRLMFPHGNLVLKKTIDSFSFDLLDLDGICASKSSERHFESVDDFGRDFCRADGATESEAELIRMLSWDEVRLTKSPDSELCLTLWDPRLFVANSGGSHHLAGAAHIARRIGKSVPIRARLVVSAFNAAAWDRLIQDYRVLLESPQSRGWSRHAVAELIGACFVEEVAPIVGEGKLVVLPRRDAAADDVTAVLESRGAIDVTRHFEEIVRGQDDAITAVCERWPQLASHLTDLRAS